MDEIASQLGISKKTIYLSFADKDDLVMEVFMRFMNGSKTNCVFDQQHSENAIHEIFLAINMATEMLKALNASVLYDLEKYYPETFKKFYAFKHDFLYTMVAANLQRGIKEKLYRPELNVDIISRLRLGTMLFSINLDMFSQTKYNMVEVEKEIILHFLHGIVTSSGVAMIRKYQTQFQERLNHA